MANANKDGALKHTQVPSPFEPWESINEFALSYNGYERYGVQRGDIQGPNSLGDFANATEETWLLNGSLPASIHELRCVLFFEQRRSRHLGDFDPWEGWDNPRSGAEQWKSYIRALIEAIRKSTMLDRDGSEIN